MAGRFGVAQKLVGLLSAGALWASFCSSAWCGQSAALHWGSSPDTNVVGYVLYFGTASGAYTSRIDVGPKLTCTASNLTEGVCYYFVATSYYGNRLESLPSNEVSFVVPRTDGTTTLRIGFLTNGFVCIEGNGVPGQTYRIEYVDYAGGSGGLAWQTAGNAVADTSGRFIIAEGVTSPQRFYRAVRP